MVRLMVSRKWTACAFAANRQAITDGVSSTAKIITGAALIIVVVFSGFARGQLVMFQQMGFGVAAALLLDATLIRMAILPSALSLLGHRSWYLPRWLRWLPHLEVEAPDARTAVESDRLAVTTGDVGHQLRTLNRPETGTTKESWYPLSGTRRRHENRVRVTR